MEPEEDDYMSEDIINQCLQSDIRPSLLFTSKERRKHEMFKKQQETKIRPFNELADERRQEGLNTAIPETNKGFALLKKMGYKPGSGTGKSEAGPCVPINLELKNDNTGLGLITEIKEKKKANSSQSSYALYRGSVIRRQELTKLKMDYRKIRWVCRAFDQKDELKKPIHPWFWPDPPAGETDDESQKEVEMEAESDSDSELKKPIKLLSASELEARLDNIVMYLREKYNYCMWCGITFDDDKDMLSTCPGRTRKAHQSAGRNAEHENK